MDVITAPSVQSSAVIYDKHNSVSELCEESCLRGKSRLFFLLPPPVKFYIKILFHIVYVKEGEEEKETKVEYPVATPMLIQKVKMNVYSSPAIPGTSPWPLLSGKWTRQRTHWQSIPTSPHTPVCPIPQL